MGRLGSLFGLPSKAIKACKRCVSQKAAINAAKPKMARCISMGGTLAFLASPPPADLYLLERKWADQHATRNKVVPFLILYQRLVLSPVPTVSGTAW